MATALASMLLIFTCRIRNGDDTELLSYQILVQNSKMLIRFFMSIRKMSCVSTFHMSI
jgi:hypothetical protein